MTIRVFLLDDHQIVRRGVRELLESDRELQVVGEGGTAAAARRLLPGLCPDVAVLDVRLPDGSGIEVCRELRSTCPGSRALLLTSVDDEDALAAAVLAGASGYLLKGIRAIGLNEAVHAAAAGAGLLPPPGAAAPAGVDRPVPAGPRPGPAHPCRAQRAGACGPRADERAGR